MMHLLYKGHGYAYELERLYRAFFLPHQAVILHDDFDFDEIKRNGDDYLLCEKIIENDKIRLIVQYQKADYFAEKVDIISLNTADKEQERLFSLLLYHVMSDYTKTTLPWGILTGIRPVKYINRFLESATEQEISEKYLISNEKMALSKQISTIQDKYLKNLAKNSFSLYISIPFCPSRCSYCSFVSHAQDSAGKLVEPYLALLLEEIAHVAKIAKASGLVLDTVYIGGGTPTTLSPDQLSRLLDSLSCFDMSHLREFTVEAGRPDTITLEKLNVIKSFGVERISINPQSMSDNVLKIIGRHHSVQQVYDAFDIAHQVGFRTINTDLIAGLPGDDFDGFAYSLNEMLKLGAQNITIHTLSLKRSSSLYRDEVTFEHDIAKMTNFAYGLLIENGFLPYYLYRQKNTLDNLENIGYAKPTHESPYNIFIMEEGQTIIGVGAGASTKLVDKAENRFDKAFNFKYPYEYINRFDEILQKKQIVSDFFNSNK